MPQVIQLRRTATAGPQKAPIPKQPIDLPCIWRREKLREETCELCSRRGAAEAIYGCWIHGECSIRKYKRLVGLDSGPQSCDTCKARMEPEKESPRAKVMDATQIVPVDDPLKIYPATDQGRETDLPLPNGGGLKNLWRGCSAFLVCGGPSYKLVPYQRLAERGIASLGVNNVAAEVPVKAMTFSDPPGKFHDGIFLDPGIMKLVPRPKLTKGKLRRKQPDGSFVDLPLKVKDCPNVWGYERRCWWTPDTFFTDPGASWGNNNNGVALTKRPKVMCSMLLGLRLLHFLGVRRVFLLGVDFWMNPAAGPHENYGFGEERTRDAIDSNNQTYRVVNDMLVEARPVFDRAGFQVFNTNQESRLKAYDYVPFDEALEDCRGQVPLGPLDARGWYYKGPKK